MANPYALYTPQNPAATFLGGFNTGLNVQRNIEETAKLVREREQAEASQRAIQDAFKKRQEVDADVAVKEATFKDKADRADAGYDVSDEDLRFTFKKSLDATAGRAKRYAEIADELIRTGLPSAIEVGMKLNQESLIIATNMETYLNNQEQAANTRRGQDIDASTRIATQVMDQTARAEQAKLDNQASMERQVAGDKAAAERNAATNKSNELIHAKSPLDLMKQRIEAITALQGAGIPDAKIDAMLSDMGPGLTTADLRDQWAGMSDEIRAQLKEAEGDLKRLHERAEEGENVGDLIKSANEEIKALRKQADEVMSSKYRQSAYRRNTTLAERALNAFGSAAETLSSFGQKSPTELMEDPGFRQHLQRLMKPPVKQPTQADGGSTREFDLLSPDTEVPVAYPDADGTYSSTTREF